jgi:hypothetical protein
MSPKTSAAIISYEYDMQFEKVASFGRRGRSLPSLPGGRLPGAQNCDWIVAGPDRAPRRDVPVVQRDLRVPETRLRPGYEVVPVAHGPLIAWSLACLGVDPFRPHDVPCGPVRKLIDGVQGLLDSSRGHERGVGWGTALCKDLHFSIRSILLNSNRMHCLEQFLVHCLEQFLAGLLRERRRRRRLDHQRDLPLDRLLLSSSR